MTDVLKHKGTGLREFKVHRDSKALIFGIGREVENEMQWFTGSSFFLV